MREPTPDKLVLSAEVIEGYSPIPDPGGSAIKASIVVHRDDTEATIEAALTLLCAMGYLRVTVLEQFAEIWEDEHGENAHADK